MSAPHPHASLLEARPHIFRSGRGRARGLVKHIMGKWRERALARPRLLWSGPWLSHASDVRRPAGPPAWRVPSFIFPFTYSFHTLPTCSVPGAVLGPGEWALRVFTVSGEETDVNQIIPLMGRNYRLMCCSILSQRQTTLSVDRVSAVGFFQLSSFHP